jgi:hypothetical protein
LYGPVAIFFTVFTGFSSAAAAFSSASCSGTLSCLLEVALFDFCPEGKVLVSDRVFSYRTISEYRGIPVYSSTVSDASLS